MASESQLVQKLITQSKKLTEANIKKCQSEQVLKELTLFKNLSTLFKNGRSIETEKVFKVSVKVLPQPYQSNSNLIARCYNETVILEIENVSKSFSLNPSYWQFVIDMHHDHDEGVQEQKTTWNLENFFEPGKVERFSLNFYSNVDIAPVEIRVRLVFSICQGHDNDKTFSATLCISTILVDALYLLSPVRVPRIPVHSDINVNFCPSVIEDFPTGTSGTFPSSSSKQKQIPRLDLDTTDGLLPSVTQFFFKFDSELLKSFVKDFLLKDSICRGFTQDIIQGLSIGGGGDSSHSHSFPVYHQDEEVLVAVKPRPSKISFKCPNPRLLVALKSAILRRLMLRSGSDISVKCPDDSICENLYALKLRLEAMSKPDVMPETDIREYMDFYLELRDVSETIEFVLVRNVE